MLCTSLLGNPVQRDLMAEKTSGRNQWNKHQKLCNINRESCSSGKNCTIHLVPMIQTYKDSVFWSIGCLISRRSFRWRHPLHLRHPLLLHQRVCFFAYENFWTWGSSSKHAVCLKSRNSFELRANTTQSFHPGAAQSLQKLPSFEPCSLWAVKLKEQQ